MQHQTHRHDHGTTAARPVSGAHLHARNYPMTATTTMTSTSSSTFMFWTKTQRPREATG